MGKTLVIGAGVMGSAVAIYLANNGQDVNLWGTQWDDDFIREMKEEGTNSSLGVKAPENMSYFYSQELEKAFEDVKLVIIVVISKGMESMAKTIAPYLKEDNLILSVTKGIDGPSLKTMSKIIEDSIPQELKDSVSVIKLGGPIIAKELAQSKYSEGVFASKDLEAAQYAASLFKSSKFRTNTSTDIEGVDLCAAFKNSYAIAMGIVEGLEEGANNPTAALMARGSLEMSRIVKAYGGQVETALGVAGVGDYYVTAQGGRNGQFGKLLGKGHSPDQALEEMNHQTVEGLVLSLNGYNFLQKLQEEGRIDIEKDLPLFNEIYQILYKGKDAKEAINDYWSN